MKSHSHILFTIALLLFFASTIADAQVTFGTGTINVRDGEYGELRIFSTFGADTVQHINRISITVAGNTDQVIDYWNDVGIQVATDLVASPVLSDYEASGVYDNSYSSLPPNFLIAQNVYGWSNQSFCLVKGVITNQETSEMPVLFGLDIIPYVDYTWDNDHIFYDAVNQQLTLFDTNYVGIKILSEPTTSAQVFTWYSGYQDSDPNYYAWLYGGTFDTDTLITDPDGGVSILGGTPTTFQPAAMITVYFAVSVGANESEMLANMLLAQQKYTELTTSVESDLNKIPSDYHLEQNYPNPFNPATKITFGLPVRSNVVLRVFNTLGEEVAEVVNESLEAGTHSYNFNASNLTSGIYIYSLKTDAGMISKKMTLLK